MGMPTDQELYDQMLGALASKGKVREREADGVLELRELSDRAFDPPLRLHVTASSFGDHLRETATASTPAHPDLHPIEAAWREFIAHVDAAAQPGETDLVLTSTGVQASPRERTVGS